MSQNELNAIPVDAWLIGHTHIPFPRVMIDLEEHKGYKIFNAGTHAQTDFHNNTAGYGFLIEINKTEGEAIITSRAIETGEIRFYDLDLNVKGDNDTALEDAVQAGVSNLSDASIIRLNLFGTARQTEYDDRNTIYDKHLKRFLFYKIDDSELSEEITIEKIRNDYAETSFAALFMEALSDDPKEMAMAYELLKECEE